MAGADFSSALPRFLSDHDIDTVFAGACRCSNLFHVTYTLVLLLIALGTRGVGPVRKAILGSFSSMVLQTAPCNVVIVHPRPSAANNASA
jgi:hypothetical protein